MAAGRWRTSRTSAPRGSDASPGACMAPAGAAGDADRRRPPPVPTTSAPAPVRRCGGLVRGIGLGRTGRPGTDSRAIAPRAAPRGHERDHRGRHLGGLGGRAPRARVHGHPRHPRGRREPPGDERGRDGGPARLRRVLRHRRRGLRLHVRRRPRDRPLGLEERLAGAADVRRRHPDARCPGRHPRRQGHHPRAGRRRQGGRLREGRVTARGIYRRAR